MKLLLVKFTGESAGAIISGLVVVTLGVLLWRHSRRFYRWATDMQRRMYGDAATRFVDPGAKYGPRQVKAIGACFVFAGTLLVVLSPWVWQM